MRHISDALEELLVRQGLRGATAGTVKPDAMGWANDLLDRAEEIEEDHSPTGGEKARPMGMRKGPAVSLPAKVKLRLVSNMTLTKRTKPEGRVRLVIAT